MADDGLLLNFELPTDAFAAPRTTFKGGRWKDRLTARKSAEYGQMKARERAAKQSEEDVMHETIPQDGERAAKRPRTDPVRQLPKSMNGEVISSLFTFNPVSTAIEEKPEAVDDGPIEPSNAPLKDELATFTTLGLSETLASHLLRRMEIKAPTAVQRKAVTQLCKDSTDAFIQAQTGSGKTLAYLLPIVQHIATLSKRMKDAGESFSRESGLFGIILAPTRELSKQISVVLEDLLSCFHWIVTGTVIGGEKKKSEKARLRKGLNILVATPGRLADHLNNTEVLDVSKVRWLVLDEGDRLMELGFQHDIQKIIGVLNLRSRKKLDQPTPGLPDQRTTIMCSATIKTNVDELRNITLKDPVTISADHDDADAETNVDHIFSAPSQLKQSYAIVPAKQRLATLVAVLKQTFKRKGSVMKCIVFISCADSVDFHFEIMTQAKQKPSEKKEQPDEQAALPDNQTQKSGKIQQGGTIAETRTEGIGSAFSNSGNPVKVFRLHGSLQQSTRTSTLKSFTQSTEPSVLICTDVASRGLDVPNIDLVIEYDPPFSKDDHLHRIGRTARAGRDGRAMIFLLPGCEENYVPILRESQPRHLTRHDASELLRKGFSSNSATAKTTGGKFPEWEDRATDFQLDVERWALSNPSHLEQARRAYQSHVRAYATHVAPERSIFDLRELHLGHLAKAFALRDKPGSIRVPGSRPTAAAGGGKREKSSGGGGRDKTAPTAAVAAAGTKRGALEMEAETDAQEARRRMMRKVRAMASGASEFNYG